MTDTDGVAVDSAEAATAGAADIEDETIIEGELIEAGADEAARADAFTLERAASEYFHANAKKLDQQQRVAVTRFVSWAGGDRELPEISAHEMTLFQEAQGANVADLGTRLLPVKAFLAYAKKKEWSETNLGVHLRVKRTIKRTGVDGVITEEGAEEVVEMTVEGLELARNELDRLRNERPVIAKKLEEAMADKDFRENAPLDAARDEQAHLEARIRDLEHSVAHARVSSANNAKDGRAHLGSAVHATNLVSNKTVEYTLVGQNEVDAAVGRISIASPVGRALVGTTTGDEVEVEAPSGTIRFRVEKVSG